MTHPQGGGGGVGDAAPYIYIYIYFVEFNLLRNDDKCKTYAKTGPPFLLAQTFDMSNPGHKQSIEMLIASQVG